MPRKRKSALSRNSSSVRKDKVAQNQESEVHAELRRQQQTERQRVLRAAETFHQTRVRSERQAKQQEARKTTERIHDAELRTTPRRNFMTKDWSVFNGTGFQYDPLVEYSNHPLIVLGSMDKKCQHCNAFKWKDETAGMCCSTVSQLSQNDF
nr:uncharacterized protein LOC118680209 [Bactrocera oleae]